VRTFGSGQLADLEREAGKRTLGSTAHHPAAADKIAGQSDDNRGQVEIGPNRIDRSNR
jgi:hypothetical protein